MNVLLDSNLEALAFNYLNFGLVTVLNNLWTWLALLTAALSFWKIRSSSCPKQLDPISIKLDSVSETMLQYEDVTNSTSSDDNNNSITESTSLSRKTLTNVLDDVFLGDDVDSVKKGKFTVYYEEDMQCGRRESADDCYGLLPVAEGWELPEDRELEWWKCWEKVLRLRNGENENGWYTCQDLTEINGNVVKIWDGGLTFVGSCITEESWYSSSCMSVFVS